MNIGQKIKEFRIRQGMNQKEFAEQIGSTQQSVSNYERGKADPSIELVMRISDTFHTSIDDILGVQSETMVREAYVLLQNMSKEQKELALRILKTIQDNDSEGEQSK